MIYVFILIHFKICGCLNIKSKFYREFKTQIRVRRKLTLDGTSIISTRKQNQVYTSILFFFYFQDLRNGRSGPGDDYKVRKESRKRIRTTLTSDNILSGVKVSRTFKSQSKLLIEFYYEAAHRTLALNNQLSLHCRSTSYWLPYQHFVSKAIQQMKNCSVQYST